MAGNSTWDLKNLFLKVVRNALKEAIFLGPEGRIRNFSPSHIFDCLMFCHSEKTRMIFFFLYLSY